MKKRSSSHQLLEIAFETHSLISSSSTFCLVHCEMSNEFPIRLIPLNTSSRLLHQQFSPLVFFLLLLWRRLFATIWQGYYLQWSRQVCFAGLQPAGRAAWFTAGNTPEMKMILGKTYRDPQLVRVNGKAHSLAQWRGGMVLERSHIRPRSFSIVQVNICRCHPIFSQSQQTVCLMALFHHSIPLPILLSAREILRPPAPLSHPSILGWGFQLCPKGRSERSCLDRCSENSTKEK